MLKTYDPVSGTCLKYRTVKAAEVGRLIAALGTCGRVMAALPEKVKEEGGVEGEGEGVEEKEAGKEARNGGNEVKEVPKETAKETGKGKAGGGGGGGGGGKKKKGKR